MLLNVWIINKGFVGKVASKWMQRFALQISLIYPQFLHSKSHKISLLNQECSGHIIMLKIHSVANFTALILFLNKYSLFKLHPIHVHLGGYSVGYVKPINRGPLHTCWGVSAYKGPSGSHYGFTVGVILTSKPVQDCLTISNYM